MKTYKPLNNLCVGACMYTYIHERKGITKEAAVTVKHYFIYCDDDDENKR